MRQVSSVHATLTFIEHFVALEFQILLVAVKYLAINKKIFYTLPLTSYKRRWVEKGRGKYYHR